MHMRLVFGCLMGVALLAWLEPWRSRHNSEGASLIEVVSRNNSVVRLAQLDLVHREALQHRGAWVYVVDGQNRMLLLRRPAHMRTCPSAWSIVGEHNLPGESYLEAAIRGVKEELGWTAAFQQEHGMSMALLGEPLFFSHDYTATQRHDRQHSQIVLLRVAATTAPPIITDAEEAGAQRWLHVARVWEAARHGNLGELCHPHLRDTVFGSALQRVCETLKVRCEGALGGSIHAAPLTRRFATSIASPGLARKTLP